MAETPRITVQELKRRMDAGEDFRVIDVRNPTAWAETDTGTDTRSAVTSRAGIQRRLVPAGRLPSEAGSGFASRVKAERRLRSAT
jgi:hypothetical protein